MEGKPCLLSFSYCSERYLPNSHGEAEQKKKKKPKKKRKKGCNHDHSEEEWVMWADLAVSGLQRTLICV